MSVLILNTLSEDDSRILNLQEEICDRAKHSEVLYCRDRKISHCIGCNYCWLKTPGICTIKDDYEVILKKILQHEKIIFVTDTRFGFVSYQTKNLVDRMMALVTMYIHFVDGQMRHVERYDIHPQMGILYTGEGNRDYLDRWLVRAALNFGGTSLGVYPLEEGGGILECI